MYLGWLVVLGILTWLFGNWEESRYNPNRNVISTVNDDRTEVILQRNQWGHYAATGTLNGKTVTYLLDTGATTVAVPGQLARELGLRRGRPFIVSTANGNATAYATTLNTITLGDIEMRNLRATINPSMLGDKILLGMNVLQHLELIQKGDTLTIRQ